MSVKYAYGYIRVSTHDQEEISPDSQEHLLRDYAAKNNIVIQKILTNPRGPREEKPTSAIQFVVTPTSQKVMILSSRSDPGTAPPICPTEESIKGCLLNSDTVDVGVCPSQRQSFWQPD